MDPNNTINPTPGLTPDPNEKVTINPATDVANAAMNGATPVVATTDLNASDIPAEPVLAPLDPNLTAPAIETPVEVGAPAPAEPTAEQPVDGTNPPEEANTENIQDSGEPIIAAAPVPGSIGSAKSYADIQREEAEKAAKMTEANGKKLKLSKNKILIIVLAVVALIGLVVGAFLIFGSSSSSTPTVTITTTSYNDEGASSTLTCSRTLTNDEYVAFGAVGGTWENIFYFKDDVLDGLETDINYIYATEAIATQWKIAMEAQYGASSSTETSVDGETTEPSTEANTDSTATGAKTAAEMLKNSVKMNGLTVTHKMEVLSEDIEEWVESDNYSDKTYGAETDIYDEEPERNLDFYKNLQNNINYTCTVSK